MGIFGDVLTPIEELIQATEGVGEQIMREKLDETLLKLREVTNDLMLRAAARTIKRRR